MKQKLPIGIQDFVSIREDGFVYLDKTKQIYELITNSGKTFFLSRPRRFGKSLLCSTLAAVFEGRRELFQAIAGQGALSIDHLDWEWKEYPVIRLDLNPGDYSNGIRILNNQINLTLALYEKKYQICFDYKDDIAVRLRNLIIELYEKQREKVVVIIDEYDKPLLATIDNPKLHKEIRDAIKGFYGVLKSCDEYLKFVFLTGVTKFSQVSVFSELNNLTDISLNPTYSDLCGITQEELETIFEPEIAHITQENDLDRQEYLDNLKRFYNGYRFSRKPQTVYNPFSLLNHFYDEGQFETYWFATGTPTFLIKLIDEQKLNILNLEKNNVMLADCQHFDLENMDALPILYQSGYLTIIDYQDRIFTLDYPNEEVRSSFAKSLLEYYIRKSSDSINPSAASISLSFIKGDVEKAMDDLKSFYASIPYNIQLRDEKYYQTIAHLVFRMLGLYCISEVCTSNGRIDSIIETRGYIFCFEFKLNGTAEEALRQIDSKEYLIQWKNSGKKLFKIGAEFDFEKRNISRWIVA
jgi:hypothetical protein